MSQYTTDGHGPARLHGHRRTVPGVANLLPWLLGLIALRRQRNALARLDDRLLADVGLSRDDVARECDKPLWR